MISDGLKEKNWIGQVLEKSALFESYVHWLLGENLFLITSLVWRVQCTMNRLVFFGKVFFLDIHLKQFNFLTHAK